MDRAPGDLELLREFVNTRDVEAGTDALDGAWLRAHGLRDEPGLPELREALRGLLLANHRGSPDPEAVAGMERAARSARPVVAFAPDGTARLEGGAVATLLGIVVRAQADGTWERLKACPADACGWAFYDRSRNRSRSWCSMSVCGNRAKARSYRARQR